MISEADVAAYNRDGFIVVPNVLDATELKTIRGVVADIVAQASEVSANNEVYDLEPTHTKAMPRVRRIKAPHKVNAIFDDLIRGQKLLDIMAPILGPNMRLYGSKLNIKAARYGSPVEWHQDWAFYPHTNQDVLAVGVMLDDTDVSNGAMMVTPGSHMGPVWNHHGEDGRFCGLIDPEDIKEEIAAAVPCVGPAGSISIHHVRALHGSALNTSNRPRNLLLYEVTASDAWPLLGVKDFDDFNAKLLSGPANVVPRMEDVPVRMPLPPASRQGSIYENQLGSNKSYFARAA